MVVAVAVAGSAGDRFVAGGLCWAGETAGPDYIAELLLSYLPAFSLLAYCQ